MGFSEEFDLQHEMIHKLVNCHSHQEVKKINSREKGTVKEVCRTQEMRQSERELEETFSKYMQVREGQSEHKENGTTKQAIRKSQVGYRCLLAHLGKNSSSSKCKS